MSSNMYQQTLERLLPGERVTLNFGLGGPLFRVADYMTQQQRLTMYRAVLPAILEPGYKAQVQSRSGEDDETTLVVQGTFSADVSYSMLLWEVIEAAQQDCIAIRYASGNGVLYGRNADRWGVFDPDQFKLFKENEHVQH